MLLLLVEGEFLKVLFWGEGVCVCVSLFLQRRGQEGEQPGQPDTPIETFTSPFKRVM